MRLPRSRRRCESLRKTLTELVETDDFVATGVALERTPELLTEPAVALLAQLLSHAIHQSDRDKEILLDQFDRFLKRCRIVGLEEVFVPGHANIDPKVVAQIQDELDHAETAESAYDETHQPTHLKAAGRARRRILANSSLASAYPGLRAALNNDAGKVFLQLYMELREEAELDAAVNAFGAAMSLTAHSSSRRANRLSNYGVALREKYRRNGDRETLESAIKACEAAVKVARGRAVMGSVFTNLSLCLRDRYLLTNEPDDLERAVKCAEQAFASAESAEAATMLGDVLHLRYKLTRNAADLTRSLELLQAAFTATSPSSASYGRLAVDLGILLLDAHELTTDFGNLSAAMGLFKFAADIIPDTSPDYPSALAHLAHAHFRRYEIRGDMDDLEQAIVGYNRALGAGLAADRAAWANNLATALRERAWWRDTEAEVVQDLAEVAGLLEGSLASCVGEQDRAVLSGSLGNVLRDRYTLRQERTDLEKAIKALLTALDLMPEGSADRALTLTNLGAAYLERSVRGGGLGDLNEAHQYLTEASDEAEWHDLDRARRLFALARVARARFEIAGDPTELTNATRAFTEGYTLGLRNDPTNTLRIGQEWGQWAAARKRWPEAVAAFGAAAKALQTVVHLQLTRQHKEKWLRYASILGADAAFAHMMVADAERAVVALESGRAMILSQELQREQTSLEELAAERPDLADRFREAVECLRRAERLNRVAP